MKFATVNDIKQTLEKQNIYGCFGKITMNLNNTSVIIKQNDIIGNALQEWLGEFLKSQKIYFRPSIGQTFPDFYLSEDNTRNLCEMKTFYATRQPAFDIANFYGYVSSIEEKPYRLDSDYLIFAYISDAEGAISVKEIWCKKVWEITGPSIDYDLKCQRKKGQIVNIRPVNWKSNGQASLKPFGSKEKLLASLYKTHLSTTNQARVSKQWLDNVIIGYKEFCGEDLTNKVRALI